MNARIRSVADRDWRAVTAIFSHFVTDSFAAYPDQDAGRGFGITNFLAHVSSLNPGSIRFHFKHGFSECGRFLTVGLKNGRPFDMVWLQKRLD